MSKYTAGPWFVSSNQVFAKQGDRIAYLAECDEQALADARLIAAAPEMHALHRGVHRRVLQRCVGYLSISCVYSSVFV